MLCKGRGGCVRREGLDLVYLFLVLLESTEELV